MADLIVPKGKEFRFNVKVIEKDSFIAQDVTNLDLIASNVKFMNSTFESSIFNGSSELTGNSHKYGLNKR